MGQKSANVTVQGRLTGFGSCHVHLCTECGTKTHIMIFTHTHTHTHTH